MQARLQAVDQGTVKEACGLAGHTHWFFSERLHPRVIGVTQVYEKLFGQHWSRSTIGIAATRYQHYVESERRLPDNGANDQQWANHSENTDLFEPAFTHLDLCDARVGLTKANVRQLDAMHHQVRVDGDSESSCAPMPGDER